MGGMDVFEAQVLMMIDDGLVGARSARNKAVLGPAHECTMSTIKQYLFLSRETYDTSCDLQKERH